MTADCLEGLSPPAVGEHLSLWNMLSGHPLASPQVSLSLIKNL